MALGTLFGLLLSGNQSIPLNLTGLRDVIDDCKLCSAVERVTYETLRIPLDLFSLENLYPYITLKKKKGERVEKGPENNGFLEWKGVLEIRFSYLISQKNKKKP